MRSGSLQSMMIIIPSIILGLVNTWYSVLKFPAVELTECAYTLKRLIHLKLLVTTHYSLLHLRIKVFISHPKLFLATGLLSMAEIIMLLPAKVEKLEDLRDMRTQQVLLVYIGGLEPMITDIFILKTISHALL